MAVVIIGPYAEWALGDAESCAVFPRDPFWGNDPFWEFLDEYDLTAAWGSTPPPEELIGGVVCRRWCFLRQAEPPRSGPCGSLGRLTAGWSVGSCDLREIDAAAEIAAFVRACGPALDRIGGRVGRAPALRWGVVTWFED
jgi:hypothetical protein